MSTIAHVFVYSYVDIHLLIKQVWMMWIFIANLSYMRHCRSRTSTTLDFLRKWIERGVGGTNIRSQ